MTIKKITPFILMVSIVGACNGGAQNTSEQSYDDSVQPMHFDEKTEDIYDEQEPSIGDMGGYHQSEQRNVNKSDFSEYSDVFTNEESIRISEELANQKDIIQAQVASTDDRIIVAVMLREHFDHHASVDIESEVRKIVPETEKQITVYTDDIQWDRMKNLDARLQAKTIGEDMEIFVEELFQLND
ncbi:YhcN/YlaJ family sporulation lipoprotein [Oceanobacillus damuensis]|uniref:YhcN/YlaJ family sporulation lipoprotein n=1 Tax=Oceanobacillus damuensis TaxID=937928 RepID=UPI00082AE1EC|nr:YhcN/YlaJ family sporulation lipoprotein [Oceanobacillus damuensis]